MKRLLTIAAALLLLAAFGASAQVTVEYIEGAVDIQDGSDWYELFIGDSLTNTDSIRLGTGAYCELSDGSRVIRLTRAGTYEIADLVESASRTERVGLGGLVLNRIGQLTGRDEDEQSTSAGGVRASEAVNQNQIEWAGGESVQDMILAGIAMLSNSDFEGAYLAFEEAYDYAFSDIEMSESAFYLGYAAFLVGNPLRATELLEEYEPDPDTEYYAMHVLALGQILLESFAFEDAIDYLISFAASLEQDPYDRQSAQLIIGLAYQGLQMNAEARRFLRRAQSTVPGTPAAMAAARAMADL
jgi:tetratricopeptide (TPR) repeat protein